MAKWALVLGGAKCLYDDIKKAIDLLGPPPLVVGVKDIWMEYPQMEHIVSYHADRLPGELAKRRKLGYPDPVCAWTYPSVRTPHFPIPIKRLDVKGGSSGLLGALVGVEVAGRAVLAGIPLDASMVHYHNRRRGRPWKEADNFKPQWRDNMYRLQDRVKSVSGWTMELLGAPTKEWLDEPLSAPIAQQITDLASRGDLVQLTNKQRKQLALKLRLEAEEARRNPGGGKAATGQANPQGSDGKV